VATTLRRFLDNIMGLPQRRGLEGKRLEGSGFETRRACHPLTHYVIVRADLPIGCAVAQTIHAAGESTPEKGVPTGTFAVALAARSEEHLKFLEEKLQRFAIPHVAVREPDPPYNGALMALGICPVADRKLVKKVTSSLPLLK